MMTEFELINPAYILLDVSWIPSWEKENVAFYRRFPLRELIEKITDISCLSNLTQQLMFNMDELLWPEFEDHFTDEEIQHLNPKMVNAIVERILARLYYQIKNHLKSVDRIEDDYVFYRWIDTSSLLLTRVSVENPTLPRYLR